MISIRRRFRLFTFVVALGIACFGQDVQASNYCSAETGQERTVIGADAVPGEALTLGKWVQDAAGLRVESMQGNRDAFWFTKDLAPANAFLRMRWTLGTRADGSFFWRAQLKENELAMVSGYSIDVEEDIVIVYRWDESTPRQMANSLSIDTKVVKTLEFVVFCIGSQLSIQIYDASTLELLGNYNLSDGAYMSGRLGFRAYRKQSSDSTFERLSFIDAALAQSTELLPIGPMRYVWLSQTDRALLTIPADCSALDKDDKQKGVYRCNQASYEVLKRQGLASGLNLKVTGNLSHSLMDDNFREKKKIWPITGDKGLDVFASYQDADMVEQSLRAYAKKFPQKARLVRIGKSVLGRGIHALVIGKHTGAQKPTILLNGAHHGMELLATDFVFDSIKELLENPQNDPEMDRFVQGLEIWCIPLVNPDGNYLYIHESTTLGRKNGRDVYDDKGEIRVGAGVDINRNYPLMWGKFKEKASSSKPKHYWYRGPRAASEPETQAMMNLVNAKQFTASISYHTVSTKILVPYSIDGMTNPQPDEAKPIAEAMAQAAGTQSNGKPYSVVKNIYNVDGTDQDWFRWAAGTTAFLIEGSQHNPLNQDLRMDTIMRNREAWKTLLRRSLSGPSIYGTVKDETGAALVAKVEITDIAYAHGEHWTSRCSDGAFERFVPKPGTYKISASIEGASVQKEIQVGADQRVRLDFVLAKPASYSLYKTLCPDKMSCSGAAQKRAKQGKCPKI